MSAPATLQNPRGMSEVEELITKLGTGRGFAGTQIAPAIHAGLVAGTQFLLLQERRLLQVTKTKYLAHYQRLEQPLVSTERVLH